MAGIKLTNLNSGIDYSTLFSSLNNGKTDNGLSTNFLADWNSLQNGSYGKLTKAYYAKNSGKESLTAVKDDDNSQSVKSNSVLKSNIDSLEKSAQSLRDDKLLFNFKTSKTDADGNVTDNYDYDKIYSKLKNFVSDYNTTINRAADSDNTTILNNTLALTKLSSAKSQSLSNVGIEIGSDNKLTINESKVKSADITELKKLFSGKGSYVDSVDSLAGNIANAINVENNKLSNYGSNGKYSSTDMLGNMYDGLY